MKSKKVLSIGLLVLTITISVMTTVSSNISTVAIANSPVFPYLVAIITILLVGIGYYILEDKVFSKIYDEDEMLKFK